jgi:ribosomal protein L11 methyltransferase
LRAARDVRLEFSAASCKASAVATARLLVATTERLAPAVSEALFAAGAQGLEERPQPRGKCTLVAYAERKPELESIWKRALGTLRLALSARELPQASVELDELESWRTNWTEHLRPIELTPRLVLAPTSHIPERVRKAQQLLLYQPALAFGDGDHPTTRLIARAIEEHYRKHPGGCLLDIGAGTGVLSMVAVVSGAARAVGTDISPEAVTAAQNNAALNGLDKRTRFVAATARLRGDFDLVAINIELRPLLEVLAGLPVAARRAERLLVTGFLADQLREVRRAVTGAGFAPGSVARSGDWRLLSAERSA